jgi:hypothetical protein
MGRSADGVYELRRAIGQFSQRPAWQFKSVINGIYWVEPPERAANRAGRPVNLVLALEEGTQDDSDPGRVQK